MAWTEETIEKLKELWAKGQSASKIAEELGEGITRNAVIGKAHRLGLKSRPSPVRVDAGKAKSGIGKGRRAKAKKKKTVGLLDLTERMCKWPIGHPGEPDFHFCGAEAVPGTPYCQAHCQEAYQTQQSRRDRRPPRMAGG